MQRLTQKILDLEEQVTLCREKELDAIRELEHEKLRSLTQPLHERVCTRFWKNSFYNIHLYVIKDVFIFGIGILSIYNEIRVKNTKITFHGYFIFDKIHLQFYWSTSFTQKVTMQTF